MSNESHQVAELAERAQNGDRTAFEQLVGLFHEDIFRMIYYRTQSRMDAEDLTQDVFLQVYRSLPGLKDVDRFRPWVFSIAVNRVRDFRRKKRFLAFFGFCAGDEDPGVWETEEDGSPGALEQILEDEFWAHVRRLAENCSPMEREVFFLRFMDHLSIKEISQVLKKSESAVKTHLYRSLKKFREDTAFREMIKGEMT